MLVSLLPIVARQTCFALKGGTAINLFIRDMPRLSVDIDLLLKNGGINDRLKNAFLVYLMGHSRPMSEMLAPRYQDISPMCKTEFQGMAFEPIQIEQLQETLPTLINQIHGALNDDDRRFLLNFKKGIQDWNKFPVPEAEHLPAVQWKQLNLNRMSRDKHKRAIDKLEKTLYGYRQTDL